MSLDEYNNFVARQFGEYPPIETRAEANETVDREQRYRQILEILTVPLTAKEVAVCMHEHGYIPNSERNFSAPRLTELERKGIVEVVGKKKCQYTGKTVSVYAKRKETV